MKVVKLEDAIREMRNGKIAEWNGIRYRVRDDQLETLGCDGALWLSPPEVKLATALTDNWSIVRETFDSPEALRRLLACKTIRRESKPGLRLVVDLEGCVVWRNSTGDFRGAWSCIDRDDARAADYYEDDDAEK